MIFGISMPVRQVSMTPGTILKLMLPLLMLGVVCNAAADDARAESREVRGVVKAGAEATISSEISGRITALPFQEGQAFSKGEELVDFDCAFYQAKAQAARAGLIAKQKEYQNNRQLEKLDAAGELEVAVSKAEVDKAGAELAVARLRMNHCRVEAPYDGRVVDLSVNVHESVGADQELIHIVDSSAPTIELIVPSTWLTWLKRGATFTFRVDEIRAVRKAVVTRLGAVVDPVSNTVKVYGKFNGDRSGVLPGMSGTARFPDDKETG